MGAGIMLCMLTLTANISYDLGQQRAAGYSENYLQTYAIITANYSHTFPEQTIDHALNAANTNCTYFKDTIESGRYLEWLK